MPAANLLLVSASTDARASLSTDFETTIADTRAVVAGTLGIDVEAVKLNFRGKVLEDDDAVWASLQPTDGEKLYAAVDTSARSRQGRNVATSADPMRQYQQQRQHMAPHPSSSTEPNLPPAMADAMLNSVTPQMIDGLFNSIPELRNLQRENPQAAAEMRRPENFRALLRSQLDPTSRRASQTAASLQLARLSNMEGGWQAVERAVHSLQRDDSTERGSEGGPEAGPSMVAPGVVRGREEQHATMAAPTESHPPQPRATEPAYAYAQAMKMLTEEMGFDEATAELALEQANGDVDAAVTLIAEWTDNDEPAS